MGKEEVVQILSSEEISAIKLAKEALPNTIKRLIKIINRGNDSQARQAAEVLLKYGLADRDQQINLETGEIGPAKGQTNLTLNKIDVNIMGMMDQLPPPLKMKLVSVIEEIEQFADQNEITIFEGEVVNAKLCECGCGEPVSKGSKWVRGHHARAHVAPPEIQATRQKFANRAKEKVKDEEEDD